MNIRKIRELSILIILIFIISGISSNVYSQNSKEFYQLALQKEVGEGNLNEAIKLYEQIIKDKNADRKVRAHSQLHIGICYEKLGIKKAKIAYQNVLDNFPGQKDVVIEAQKRIEKLTPATPPINLEARAAFLKAEHYLGRGEIHRVVEFYKEAIALDSTYANAYSGLAKSYAFSGQLGPPLERAPIAIKYALKALKNNFNLAEAHSAIGLVNMFYYWDWEKAESEFLEAIKINANDIVTLNYYAILLTSQGRFDEALVKLEKAISIDPVNHYNNELMADIYYYSRDYDQAITQYLKTLELHPHSRVTHLKLSGVYHQQDREDEEILSINRYFLAIKNTALANIFMKTYNELGYESAILKWAQLWEPGGRGKGVQGSSIALIYLRINEYEKAIEWLQIGYETRDNDMINVGIRPMYDPIRSDERFLDLIEKIGLPYKK